jgi:hypothetical protein
VDKKALKLTNSLLNIENLEAEISDNR